MTIPSSSSRLSDISSACRSKKLSVEEFRDVPPSILRRCGNLGTTSYWLRARSRIIQRIRFMPLNFTNSSNAEAGLGPGRVRLLVLLTACKRDYLWVRREHRRVDAVHFAAKMEWVGAGWRGWRGWLPCITQCNLQLRGRYLQVKTKRTH